MSDAKIYPVTAAVRARAWIDNERYQQMYRRSLEDPDGFWAEQAERFLSWFGKWRRVQEWEFTNARIKWFEGARLNAAWNCLDRHLAGRAEQTAIIWEGDEPGMERRLTYLELHDQVCRLANVLKDHGIGKGDCVSIYLPMIPESAIAILACARIGAVHSVVFGGFSAEALKDRIQDSDCRLVITADESLRGGRRTPLKANTDAALEHCPNVQTVIVVKRTGGDVAWKEGRDVWYEKAVEDASPVCLAEPMDAEDPLFILYTSGSTGKPKGVLHTTAGYLLHVAMTHRYVFDYHDGDIYWCAADVGWVTGHSYIVYGPLCNGATTLMYEGVPNHPDPGRWWRIVDQYQVNILYPAPTALRALMAHGDDHVKRSSRASLRLLGTVGEPINPEAWEWYHRVVGDGRCPVVDTWWQTETGGILVTPLPGATDLKPGSATRPFFGIEPCIVDEQGRELEGEASGAFCIKRSWPGQMRTVYGDHERFVNTYFRTFTGKYFTGDGARRDADGYYWITGRMDDVINVAGHRLGTAEIESALVLHPAVAEAAVVGYPHPIKGTGIYAYVTLMVGIHPTEELRQELTQHVRKEIGPIASPDLIQWAPGLPKTRSGKIMRRILRKVAANEVDQMGDTSTLADPAVVDDLVHNRANK